MREYPRIAPNMAVTNISTYSYRYNNITQDVESKPSTWDIIPSSVKTFKPICSASIPMQRNAVRWSSRGIFVIRIWSTVSHITWREIRRWFSSTSPFTVVVSTRHTWRWQEDSSMDWYQNQNRKGELMLELDKIQSQIATLSQKSISTNEKLGVMGRSTNSGLCDVNCPLMAPVVWWSLDSHFTPHT